MIATVTALCWFAMICPTLMVTFILMDKDHNTRDHTCITSYFLNNDIFIHLKDLFNKEIHNDSVKT